MRTIYIQNDDGTLTEVTYDETTGTYSGSSVVDDPRLSTVAQYPELTTVGKKDYAGSSHSTSIEEVYNQLILTCELEELEEIVDSPTDDDTMYSPFISKQKYATEYCSWGAGSSAFNGFKELIANGATGYDGGEVYNHYVQVYKSKAWEFNGDRFIDDTGHNQQNVLKEARRNSGTAFLAAFGHTEPASKKDNSVNSKIDMQKYLVISVNGWTNATSSRDYEDDEEDDPNNIFPKESDLRAWRTPLAKYTANKAGGYLSPTDDKTKNYLVIQGKMFLEGIRRRNSQYALDYSHYWTYPMLKEILPTIGGGWLIYMLFSRPHLDNSKNGDGCYYAVRFFQGNTPDGQLWTQNEDGVMPRMPLWDKEEMGDLKYGWSANGDETDLIKKLPLIQCTLKVGDKYCCEMYDANGDAYFEWHAMSDPNMPYDTYQGERVPRNHIYIGFDPKIDDWFIGAQEYDIANNVWPEYNIDEEGMCIPITAADALSGKVEFTIDGVCNLTYDNITRRHPTMFRSTKWYHNLKYVLAHIQTIFIKDFNIKIYTDQAGINNIPEDRDLVYMTDELSNEKYINKKDDIEFKINTALTTEECEQKLVT